MPCDKPDCTHPHEMEIDYTEPKIPKASTTLLPDTNTSTVQVVAQQSSHEEPKTDIHDEIAKNLPMGVNCATCANGECGKIIKNPKGMTTKFKACPNCHDNTNRKSAKVCKTCGKKPEEEEDWEESEVEIEVQDGD